MQVKKISSSIPVVHIDTKKIITEVSIISGEFYNLIKKYSSIVFTKVRRLIRQLTLKRKGDGDLRQLNRFDGSKKKRINLQKTKISKAILYIVITVAVVAGLGKLIDTLGSTESSKQIEIKGAKANQVISREFLFPLKNGQGENLSDIKFFIDKAEMRDEIVVQGKRATSVRGRTFLIISLKITNQYRQAISMNTKDYLRLSVNGNQEEWLAPDIHNDPVEIQAISTKLTRVGFPINDSDRDLILRVGEINGEKEMIPLDFK